MASSDAKGAVSASTRNSPGAPAESPVERRMVRETRRVSDRPHTRKPPQRTQPQTDAGWTRQGQPHHGAPNGYDAESAHRPCLGRGQRFSAGLCLPRAAAQYIRGQRPLVWGKAQSGKPTRAPRATGPDEARRTTRGHGARQRGTLPATSTGTRTRTGVTQERPLAAARPDSAHNTQRNKAHQQVPGKTAAVRMDVCGPGSEPGPCRLMSGRRPD